MASDQTAALPSPEVEAAADMLRTAGWIVTPPSEVKYGCFLDLWAMDPGTEPDDCVIDTDCRADCVYAHGPKRHERKEQCEYWKAWTPETLAAYWKENNDGAK